jgi:hypothetical protein
LQETSGGHRQRFAAPASLRPHRFCCCEEAFLFGVASLRVRVSCRSLSVSRMCVLSCVLANSSEPVIVAYGGRLCFFLCFSCAVLRKCFGTQMSSTTYWYHCVWNHRFTSPFCWVFSEPTTCSKPVRSLSRIVLNLTKAASSYIVRAIVSLFLSVLQTSKSLVFWSS